MPTSSYRFFPWARRGLAASLEGPGSLDDPLPERIALPVALELNQRELSDVEVEDLQLLGPGDVTGIDERVIVRVTPSPRDAGFKPNDLPLIEFAHPDFPWLFTPGTPDQQGRLRPWLCLVCVEEKAGVSIDASPARPLPVLEIGPTDDAPGVVAGAELPDPNEAWAWAHVLVTGEMGPDDTVESVHANHPERVVSRILCPRNLEPHKRYHACLVPLFEAGRRAGLGQEGRPSNPDENGTRTLTFAWTTDTVSIRLPVYHRWEFRTGFEGDFESLARLLEPGPVPPEVGTRLMDMSDPGFDVPTVPVRIPGLEGADERGDTGQPILPEWLSDPVVDIPARLPGLRVPVVRTVHLEGALRGPTLEGRPVREENPTALAKQVESLLEDPSAPAGGGPVAGPPIYGRYHANRTDLPAQGAGDAWLRTLNLDVRHRAAAGVGGAIVRDQQEQLMASAWDQVGQIRRANQVLRQAQMSREAGGSSFRKHLLPLAGADETEMDDGLLRLTAPAHTRVTFAPARPPGASDRTVRSELTGSSLPPAAVSSAFRRIARPRGPHARRAFAGEAAAGRILSRVADGTLRAAPPLNRPPHDGQLANGTQVMDPLPAPGSLTRDPETGLVPETEDPAQLLDRALELPRDPEAARQLADAFELVLWELEGRSDEPEPPTPDLASIRDALLEKLDPERAVGERIGAQLRVPSGLGWSEDDLEPIMAAPEFPSPMYEPLSELSPDLLLPGLRYVPSDTITLVETNPEFIESYMVGLNHAMSEELLWREFLTDQRGTYFQRFWDVAGTLPGPGDPDRDTPDLTPIHTWAEEPGTPLGGHLGRGGGGDGSGAPPGMAVLMIRGQLLRLYPNTMIYAVEGAWDLEAGTRAPAPGATPVHPVFRGTLEPDATFLGFNLTLDQIRGHPDPNPDNPSQRDAGWFFVIQGPPTEPRFGLDETLEFSDSEIGEDPPDWNAIAWGDLVQKQGSEEANREALDAMTHIRVSPDETATSYRTPGQRSPQGADAETVWGHNSAHMAYITLQLPVRLAIHADDMLPPSSG